MIPAVENQPEKRKMHLPSNFLFSLTVLTKSNELPKGTMPNFAALDFYESIVEASNRGELWGIENTDLTPLEINLILSRTSNS